MPCWTLFQHLQPTEYTRQVSFNVKHPELGIDVCPQIWDLESGKPSLWPHHMHPNNKGWWWCWDKQVQSRLMKPKLEMKKKPGNFCTHHPVTFEEPNMVYASEIRSFIWKCLRKNLSCTLVQLLPLAVSWEISVQDFRPFFVLTLPSPPWSSVHSVKHRWEHSKQAKCLCQPLHPHMHWMKANKRTNNTSNGVPQ